MQEEERVGRWAVPTWTEEEPREETTGFDAGETGSQALELLKQNWKTIVLAIVAIFVVYGFYYFFIASVKAVTISAENLEGKPIKASFKIYGEASPKAIDTFSNKKTLNLSFGTYFIDAASAGYKAKTQDVCTVTESTPDCIVTLEKETEVKIKAELREVLLIGYANKGKIILENSGDKEETIELSFGKDFSKQITIEIEKEITLPPRQIVQKEIVITPEKDYPLDRKEKTAKITGEIAIKLTRESVKIPLTIVEFDSEKVKINLNKIDFGRVYAGDIETKPKEFKITNDNKNLVLENLKFELVNIETSTNPAEEIKNWLTFIPEKLEKLETGSRNAETIAVKILVPIKAFKDQINGRIRISNEIWSKEIPFSLIVEVKEAELVIGGLKEKYTLNKDPDTGEYISETDVITLENKGDLAIENIQAAIKDDCDSTWVELLGKVNFTKINSGEKKSDTRLETRASSTTAAETSKVCTFGVLFTDPRNPLGERKRVEKSFEIRTD